MSGNGGAAIPHAQSIPEFLGSLLAKMHAVSLATHWVPICVFIPALKIFSKEFLRE
jgi:hypothetical protein